MGRELKVADMAGAGGMANVPARDSCTAAKWPGIQRPSRHGVIVSGVIRP
jgi:hypothetical protein